jgi:hypothetical protein
MRIGEIIEQVRTKATDIMQNHRRTVLLSLGGLSLLVFLILIGVLLLMNYSLAAADRAAGRDLSDTFKPLAVPPEDFFLPEEPDFLPEALLEKEGQGTWSAEDARPFWKDPLQENPDLWRERMETVIDRLMERVP